MLYERLKKVRERIGMTQVEVAKRLGLTKSGYCRYENEIDIIPLKHLIEVCNIFNVSLDYIFNFNDSLTYEDLKKEIDLTKMGERLKEFRKSNKLTQKDLASVLNVARSIISKYEKGEYLIATHTLYSISKKYQISADYLLGRINTNKKD